MLKWVVVINIALVVACCIYFGVWYISLLELLFLGGLFGLNRLSKEV